MRIAYTMRLMVLAVVLSAVTVLSAADEIPEGSRIAVLTKLTPMLLANAQYRHAPYDDNMSSLTFDEFFRLLDPNKCYFTKQDMEHFEPYRNQLDDLTAKGDSTFVFEVYDLFKQRVAMYTAFAEETLKKPFDFTVNESVQLDRRDLDYFANMDELKEFWRKKLKSEVLNNRLARRAMEYQKSQSDTSDLSEEDKKKLEEATAVEKIWARSPEEQVLRRLRDINNVLEQNDKIDILAIFLAAVSHSYGPHTDYFAPTAEENFDITMKLSLYGIGATLTTDDGLVKVVEVVPGSPAAREGSLRTGDRIIAVAQEGEEPVDVVDMAIDRVVKMVRGPENSKVTLTVLPAREGRGGMPRQITIVRGKVELKESEAKGEVREISTPGGKKIKIGIISLDSFYMDFDAYLAGDKNFKSCTGDVRKILDDFNAKKVDALVMDMRNNGGGSLPEAITLSGLFISDGPVVQVRPASGDREIERDKDSSISFTGPMAVLTNRLTSSSAEIFSGAMKDYQRAIIIGDSRTYGKGTVLQQTKLDRVLKSVDMDFPAGSIRYECAVFYRINGDSTQLRGIKPDVVFPTITDHMEIGEEFSNNHLPWDSISPVGFKPYYPDFGATKSALVAKSASRLETDPVYKKYSEQVEWAAKRMNEKEISLNEEVRFNDYLHNDEFRKFLDKELDTTGIKASEGKDLELNEAMNVLADWLDLPEKTTLGVAK
ncbi:MAG: carboxy terminal-processing peptidase [Victivallaceae bacterium]|nr:carboxy terminal-processing peptidase [Victivallaceae bacterium]